MSRQTLATIAARIDAHLKRMERDEVRNLDLIPATAKHREQHLSHFYMANCWYAGGAKIRIAYITYQGSRCITRDEALAYLAWLDAGNYGKHHAQQRQSTPLAPGAPSPTPTSPSPERDR